MSLSASETPGWPWCATGLLVVAASCVLLACFQAQVNCLGSSDEIRAELDRIEDDGGFSEDMEDFQDEMSDYTRSRKRSVDNYYARMKIAGLLAEIGQIKHAIRSKFVQVAKRSLDEFDKGQLRVDLRELELFMARSLVRSKIAILLHTSELWKQVYKFAEVYRNSVGNDLDYLEERNALKGPLNAELELQVQERVLKRYEEFEKESDAKTGADDEKEPEAEASSAGSSPLSTLEEIDVLVDNAFDCEDDCLALAEEQIAQGIPALATSATVEIWRQQFIDEMYRDELTHSEQLLAKLAVSDPKYRPVTREQWSSISLEQVEQFRRDLRGEEEEAAYRDNFDYFRQ